MKRLRLRTLLLVGVAMFVAFDVGVTAVVLPRYWRPLPPFGAVTTEAQSQWLERELAAEKSGRDTGIGRFDRRLGWSHRPDSSSGFYHINSRGWRSLHEYPPEPEPGTLRIVACGDSFTFGQEVEDGEAWPAVLEGLLPRAQVINLGVGGYGTDQALLRLQGEDLGAWVDVALMGILLENIGRNVNRYRPRWFTSAARPVAKPRFVVGDDGLRLVEQPFVTRAELVAAVSSGEVLDRLAADEYWDDAGVPWFLGWSGVARLVGGRAFYARRRLAGLWSDTAGEPFRTTVAILEAFHRHAREGRGARHALVLVFPTMTDLARFAESGDRYWSTLLDALAERGIDCLDLTDPLVEAWEARAEGGAPVYVGTHLSPEANVVVADAVRVWLEEHLER